MEKKIINGVTILWNDVKYDKTLFDENMIIYKLSYIDDMYYIGKTKQSLIKRLEQHCSDDNDTNNGKHIQEYKYLTLDILYKANDEVELDRAEKEIIRKHISLIAEENECDNITISNEIINNTLLNEILYR